MKKILFMIFCLSLLVFNACEASNDNSSDSNDDSSNIYYTNDHDKTVDSKSKDTDYDQKSNEIAEVSQNKLSQTTGDNTTLKNVEKILRRINDPDADIDAEILSEFQYEAFLVDVRGQGGSGIAYSTFKDAFKLESYFEFLPAPDEGYYYEGWIVRDTPFSEISTGRIDFVDGYYMNSFVSEEDLTDHTFYFISLESEDGDQAPDEHVFEGNFNPL